MKKLLLVSFLFIFISACSEEKKFEVTNTEAFAYSLDSGWELNASVNVAGFEQKKGEDDEYSAKLSYSFHLITPESDTLYEADYGFIDKQESEELMDIQIESQLELDSTSVVGLYKIIFEITDDFTGKTISADAEFELTAD